MSQAPQQRPLFARRWWLLQCVLLLPLFNLFANARLLPEQAGNPLYVLALCSLFLTLPLFRRYKLALIHCGKARETEAETAAWARLHVTQRNGLLGALVPALLGVPAQLAGAGALVQLLLLVASLTIASLYRLPRQLD